MSTRRWSVPLSFAALLICSLVAALGCGGDDPYTAPAPSPPADTGPVNASPESTMARFAWAYENQRADELEALLTDDFRFLFSPQADPDLVTQYGTNWKRVDESTSARHLFDGFTNDDGDVLVGAQRVELAANSVEFGTDGIPMDSIQYYRIADVPHMVLEIEVPSSPEPLIHLVDSRQVFVLVRGDAAVLAAGQEARSDRWYIRRWDDRSQPIAGTSGIRNRAMPATGSTWGKIKASYR